MGGKGIATIILLYKKGDHEDLFNYRPISLLNCFSNLFVKVPYYQLFIPNLPYFTSNATQRTKYKEYF